MHPSLVLNDPEGPESQNLDHKDWLPYLPIMKLLIPDELQLAGERLDDTDLTYLLNYYFATLLPPFNLVEKLTWY